MARVKLQTLLDRSNKNMASGTHAVVRETALEVIKRAYKEGINVQISEGHRSYTRQNELYAQGRTKPGNIVTNAKGGQSWHNFGIAVDYFLTTNDGSKAVWTVNSDWRRVAQIAKGLGFEWGGDWTSFKDYPHLQMTGGYTLAQLRNGAKPKLTSKVKNPAPTITKKIAEDGWFGKDTATVAMKVYNMKYVDGIISGQPNNASTRNIPAAQFGSSGSNLIREMAKEFGVPAKYRDGKITNPSMLIEAMQRYYGTPVDKKVSGPSMVIKEWQKALNKGKRK